MMKGSLATFGTVTHTRMNLPMAVCPSMRFESKWKSKNVGLLLALREAPSIASSYL